MDTQIEQARPWSPRAISKFETLIRSGDEAILYRANPLAFARDRGVAEPESIDLFLHAARAGLVDMHWDILCPHSGLVLESFGKLRALRSHFGCGLCDIEGAGEAGSCDGNVWQRTLPDGAGRKGGGKRADAGGQRRSAKREALYYLGAAVLQRVKYGEGFLE
jgi:hypothetical protein